MVDDLKIDWHFWKSLIDRIEVLFAVILGVVLSNTYIKENSKISSDFAFPIILFLFISIFLFNEFYFRRFH